MKQADLLNKINSGTPCAVLEYRSTQVDKIEWRDKESGRQQVMKKATHNCEAGTQALAISEMLPENADLTTYKPPFQKGQMVVWEVSKLTMEKGVKRLAGKLELLEK
jgi:hypothetical protein